jgi:hypothetical protein
MSGHSDISTLKDDWNKKQVASGDSGATFWNTWDTFNTDYEKTLWDAQGAVDAGQISLADFKDRVSTAASNRAALQEQLKSDQRYADVVSKWTNPKSRPDYAGDIAYDEYVSIMYGSTDLQDQYGVYNYNLRQQREDAFKTRWGSEIYQYVQDRLREGRDEPPLMAQYRTAQVLTRPYWEVKENLIAMSDNPQLEQLDALATEVGRSNPALEQEMRAGHPVRLENGDIVRCTILAALQRQVDAVHRLKRETNPTLEEALQTWYAY